jgi:hypothetical protein
MVDPTNTSTFPVKGQKFCLHYVIRSYATGNPLTGSLSGLVAKVSKDGGSFSSTATAAAPIGTTGYGLVELSASEMDANAVFVTVSSTSDNAVEFCAELRPLDLAEATGHWKDRSVQRLEQAFVLMSAFFTNPHMLTMNTESIKNRDGSITMISGSVSGLTDGGSTVTRNKME